MSNDDQHLLDVVSIVMVVDAVLPIADRKSSQSTPKTFATLQALYGTPAIDTLHPWPAM
jgi:hypothetical protein